MLQGSCPECHQAGRPGTVWRCEAESPGRMWKETVAELRGVHGELQAEAAKLSSVAEALREWEAAGVAERAHTLAAVEAMEEVAEEEE